VFHKVPNLEECDATGDAILHCSGAQKKSHYIISIARAKYVQTPGRAIQKNCLTSGVATIKTMIASHIKKYIQYFVLDFLTSMYKNLLQK
jgi:hypothetical protein